MKLCMIVVLILLTACMPPSSEAPTFQIATPAPRIQVTGTTLPVTPTATPTELPGSPTLTSTPLPTPSPEWKVLAIKMMGIAQQAIKEKHWEDIQFKKEAYVTCGALIANSTGKVQEDSKEVLKRFRWGIEFMDRGQLQEVINLLDQYN